MSQKDIAVEALIRAYGDWIILQTLEGRRPYYINIMFEPLGRLESPVTALMGDAVYASKGSFYSKLCRAFDKHPGRNGRHRYLPHAFLFFDLPVFKRDKKQPLRDLTMNRGLHINGVMTIPPQSRIKDDSALYAQKGIKRIHVQPLTHDPHRVADYAMKTLKSGRVDWDSAIILPRSRSELRSNRLRIDARTRAMKDIQSAMNVSDETAEYIHHLSMKK